MLTKHANLHVLLTDTLQKLLVDLCTVINVLGMDIVYSVVPVLLGIALCVIAVLYCPMDCAALDVPILVCMLQEGFAITVIRVVLLAPREGMEVALHVQ